MIYITGDTHREFSRLDDFNGTKEDMLIILGDAGINYQLDFIDACIKEGLKKYKMKFFLVRGNHEERPENIPTYKEKLETGAAFEEAGMRFQILPSVLYIA